MTADDLRPEISDWAEHVAQSLAEALLEDGNVGALLYAATPDDQLAYEVLIALARTVGDVLRPTGHAGGPIGWAGATASRHIRAAQLIGTAAAGDIDLVDALARASLTGPTPLDEARATLRAILEVLALEPVLHDPPEGTP